jgi:hypothetical protein
MAWYIILIAIIAVIDNAIQYITLFNVWLFYRLPYRAFDYFFNPTGYNAANMQVIAALFIIISATFIFLPKFRNIIKSALTAYLFAAIVMNAIYMFAYPDLYGNKFDSGPSTAKLHELLGKTYLSKEAAKEPTLPAPAQ